ncbi:MAG: 3-oxoacyl-[acyl-carrier-protein] synthase III C-terminal domain-containing protein [Candidatus Bathyarchaeia archaeon]
MVFLLGLSTAVPHQKYTTEELIELFPCELPDSVRQNISNLGVYTRYLAVPTNFLSIPELASNDAGLDVCVEACKRVLGRLGISIEDIDYFIATYDASPFLCPGLSSLLVRRLGFAPSIKHVSLQGTACTAFTQALELAEDHLAGSPRDYVMICLSGVNSYWFCNQVRGLKNVMGIKEIQALKNEKRRRRELRKWIAALEFFLFGDGVASMIVAREGKGPRITDIFHVTNLRKTDYLAGYARLTVLNEPFSLGFLSHLDRGIRKLGLEYTSVVLEKLFGENLSEHEAEVKKWVVHTGSKAILDGIAENYSIKREKLKESYEVLAKYGNLAGASLPFILERIMQEGKLQENDQVIVLGFGWGFSASVCSMLF